MNKDEIRLLLEQGVSKKDVFEKLSSGSVDDIALLRELSFFPEFRDYLRFKWLHVVSLITYLLKLCGIYFFKYNLNYSNFLGVREALDLIGFIGILGIIFWRRRSLVFYRFSIALSALLISISIFERYWLLCASITLEAILVLIAYRCIFKRDIRLLFGLGK